MKNTLKKATLLLFVVCFAAGVSAQDKKTINGKVIDQTNEAVIGATVVVDGTSEGTITDVEGNYELSVPDGATISVSFTGMTTEQAKITVGKIVYNFALKAEQAKMLDDVVAIGYGTQKRSELTGSMSSVSANDIKDFSSKSLAESLSGMAAGVTVTKGDGSPGASADIMIRGAGSINGLAPLYVVDGVAQDAGFQFNMRDVESIEILKDAGSAAIYGSRAAGGVILITTKHGQKGEKASISANARVGFRNIYSNIHLLNTEQWIKARDAWGNGNSLLNLGVSDISELPNVDWIDVMFGTGIEQEYNVSLTAATDKTNVYLSIGYLGEKGVYMDTKADRFSFRNNLDYKFSKHITIGEAIYGSMTKTNPSTNSSIYNNTIPFRTTPILPVYDENGDYYINTDPNKGSGPNFAALEDAFHVFNDNNYTLNAQVYMNINFLKGLDLRVTGAGEFYGFSTNRFTEYQNAGMVTWGVPGGSMMSAAGTVQNLMYNAVLTFDRDFGKHNLKLMAGTEWWKKDGYKLRMTVNNFSIPVAESVMLGSEISPVKQYETDDELPIERRGSFFGRLSYNYQSKYLLTANFRADASDRFIKKNRWGFFPSVNVGWRFSEENFVKDHIGTWLNNGKIRASWGILGNDNVAQFMYVSSYSGSGIGANFDGSSIIQNGYWLAVVGNEDLKWEEINQLDLGVDFSFLKNRLTVTYDYYNRQTKDMLYQSYLPLSGGFAYYFSSDRPANTVPFTTNAGLIENKGHEISITWNDKTKHGFSYSISANASFNKNTVKQVGEVPGATPRPEGLNNEWTDLSRTQDGLPLAMFYGYGVLGIFQNQEQVDEYNQRALDAYSAEHPDYDREANPLGICWYKANTGVGDLIYDDNGVGRVTEASRKIIGNPWPKMTYGINLNLAYKGFDLSAVFQGALGFDIMNLTKPYTHQFASDNTTSAIFETSCFGATRDENGVLVQSTKVTDNPRVGYLDENESMIGDGAANGNYKNISAYFVEKGDYLKLKNLSFGYTLPQKLTQKARIQNLRIYASMQNVFVITKYSGIDPEIGNINGKPLLRGVDHINRYLPSRLISFGIDLTF
ncbi:MAG: TonB-dependent receptor [Prevotellaceae bacterium]|jgi:TonB-linked SusC/RagA family outer membrane protein|nr:TonB-dependent receptor [Prevotellaceae bacterium]